MRESVLALTMCLVIAILSAPTGDIQTCGSNIEEIAVLSDDPHSHVTVQIGKPWPGLCEYEVLVTESSLQAGTGIYGSFQVTYPASGSDQIIDFFMCDQTNYDLWRDGQEAAAYHKVQNEGSYSYKLRIPTTEKWYFVFGNWAFLTSKTVEFDFYIDMTPPSISMNLVAGATY